MKIWTWVFRIYADFCFDPRSSAFIRALILRLHSGQTRNSQFAIRNSHPSSVLSRIKLLSRTRS